MKSAILFGASAGLGRALAEELSKEGYSLMLIARGERDLQSLAQHLTNLYGNKVLFRTIDFSQPGSALSEAMELANTSFEGLERVFLVAGSNSEHDEIPARPETLETLLKVNGLAPAQVLNYVCDHYSQLKTKSITICSTVAVTAPRKRNIAYASSKAYLEFFAQGAQHYFKQDQVKVHIVRLGYLKTNLSFGQDLIFPKADPKDTARYLIKKMDRPSGLTYYPKFWFIITSILKLIPRFIFRRLSF